MFHQLFKRFNKKETIEGNENGEGETPTGEGETPTDEGETPTDEGETSTDEGETPTGEGETSTDEGETPTGEGETNTNNNLMNLLKKIFNEKNLKLTLTFLAIFALLYIILGIFFKIFGTESQNALITVTNYILFIGISIVLLNNYYYLNETEKNNILEHTYKKSKESIQSYETTFTLIIMIAFFTGVQKILHLPTQEGRTSFMLDTTNVVLWLFLVINVFVILFNNLLQIPIIDIIENTLYNILYGDINLNNSSSTPETSSTPQPAEEVFNVSNNLYTFDDAPHVCSALGARLASYDEIEKAYDNGADWCTYGWSENQMAFFPTQKETWQKLQSNNAMKNSCGRPGVNGGYIPNPKMRLGVNCYGVKPEATDVDLNRMQDSNNFPKTSSDILTERKIAFWKENASKMLNLNSYNKNDWSMY